MQINPLLHPYQKEGVEFLVSGYHRLLADDMGLGKTVQAIEACNVLDAQKIIIICPATVKLGWARELAVWSNIKDGIVVVRGTKFEIPDYAKVIIINYDLLRYRPIFEQLIKHAPYAVMICDEAQNLRNAKASRTNDVLSKRGLITHTVYAYMLSGTPVVNRPFEFFPMLRTMAYDLIMPYTTTVAFGNRYCLSWKGDFRGHKNLDELNERIQPFMLRRTKDEVLPQLPDKVEQIIELECAEPLGNEEVPLSTRKRVLGEIKVPFVVAHCKEVMSGINKLVVFAHHREVINQLTEELSEYNPVKLLGGLSIDAKQKVIDEFVTDDSVQILVGQITAAGTGVDGLQKVCSYIIFAELDWSPAVLDQCIDRCRRIGQKDTVFVQYLVVPNSLEDIVWDTLADKRRVIRRIMKQKRSNVMSLETTLERIAVALETMAANVGTSAPTKEVPVVAEEQVEEKPAAKKGAAKGGAKKEVKAEKVLTTEDLRAQAAKFVGSTADTKENKEKVKLLVNSIAGVEKIADVPEEHIQAVYDALLESPDEYSLEETEDDEL